MQTLFAVVAALIVFCTQAMAQDAPQTQPPKVKPGLNLLGEKYVDPRVKEFRRKPSIGSMTPRSKKYRIRKRRMVIPRGRSAQRWTGQEVNKRWSG